MPDSRGSDLVGFTGFFIFPFRGFEILRFSLQWRSDIRAGRCASTATRADVRTRRCNIFVAMIVFIIEKRNGRGGCAFGMSNNLNIDSMELNVSPEKTQQMVDRYNNDTEKGDISRKEYATKLAKEDPSFVPWLFNFENSSFEGRSDLSTGMSRDVNSAFDNWVDIYDNF